MVLKQILIIFSYFVVCLQLGTFWFIQTVYAANSCNTSYMPYIATPPLFRFVSVNRQQSNFSMNRPLGRFSLLVLMSVCVYVCLWVFVSVPSRKPLFERLWRLLVKSHPPNIPYAITQFCYFLLVFDDLGQKKTSNNQILAKIHNGGVGKGRVCGCA